MLEEPWALITLAEESHRAALADAIEGAGIELLAAGPVSGIGMHGGGTLDEIAVFMAYIEDLRNRLGRPLAVVLVHHENRTGNVSGAWEGKPDTLVHVQAQGNGHTRVYWRKVRWSSALHGKTWRLNWREGESFEVDDTPEITDDDVAASILSAVRENPGASMRTVEKHSSGRAVRVREVRDLLLESGALVNLGTGGKFKLFAADDATLREMRPDPDAPGTHTASATGSTDRESERVPRPALMGTQGRGRISGEPAEDVEDDA